MSKSFDNRLKELKELKSILLNKYESSPKIFDKHINKTYKKMHNEIKNALNYQPDIFKIIYKRFIKEHKHHIEKSIKYWENVRCMGFDKKCKEQQRITKKLEDIISKLNSNSYRLTSLPSHSSSSTSSGSSNSSNSSSSTSSGSSNSSSSTSSGSSNSSSNSYNFLSVPINNPQNYCYQASVFQLLFSIDIIRNESSNYKTYANINNNVFDILNEMNINKKTGQVINKKNIQDNLANKFFGNINKQEDASQFLLNIFNNFENIDKINDEITFYDATYSFCEKNINIKYSDLMNKPNGLTNDVKKIYSSKSNITSSERNILMNIEESKYKNFGYLFHINGILSSRIFILSITDNNAYWSIEKLLNESVDEIDPSSEISNIKYNHPDCEKITRKIFLKIPDKLNYICFQKRLVEKENNSYNFLTCKNLTINNVRFELRGYISHFGILRFEYGQISAKSGHYVYISIENNKQVLYNDARKPQYIDDNDNSYISRGYVFLYKRVR